jgi:hypothetical protein
MFFTELTYFVGAACLALCRRNGNASSDKHDFIIISD